MLKELLYTLGIVTLAAIVYISVPAGASPGDHIWIGKWRPFKFLELTEKAKLKQSVVATWPDVTGNNVDIVQCETTPFVVNQETSNPDIPCESENVPVGCGPQAPTVTPIKIMRTGCKFCDEQQVSDKEFVRLHKAGQWRPSDSGSSTKCFDMFYLVPGSIQETKWNSFSNAVYGRKITEMSLIKVWRSNPNDKTIFRSEGKNLMIGNDTQYRQAVETNEFEAFVDVVQ